MMFWILFGLLMVFLAFGLFLMLQINWKTGDWKGKYKGKVLPF